MGGGRWGGKVLRRVTMNYELTPLPCCCADSNQPTRAEKIKSKWEVKMIVSPNRMHEPIRPLSKRTSNVSWMLQAFSRPTHDHYVFAIFIFCLYALTNLMSFFLLSYICNGPQTSLGCINFIRCISISISAKFTDRQTDRQTDSHILSFVCLCMTLYDCVWLCMTMYDYV